MMGGKSSKAGSVRKLRKLSMLGDNGASMRALKSLPTSDGSSTQYPGSNVASAAASTLVAHLRASALFVGHMRAALHQAGLVLGVEAWVWELVRMRKAGDSSTHEAEDASMAQEVQQGLDDAVEQGAEQQQQQQQQQEGARTDRSEAPAVLQQVMQQGVPPLPASKEETECRRVIEDIRTRTYGALLFWPNHFPPARVGLEDSLPEAMREVLEKARLRTQVRSVLSAVTAWSFIFVPDPSQLRLDQAALKQRLMPAVAMDVQLQPGIRGTRSCEQLAEKLYSSSTHLTVPLPWHLQYFIGAYSAPDMNRKECIHFRAKDVVSLCEIASSTKAVESGDKQKTGASPEKNVGPVPLRML
eukprot:1134250-Pelagomonas_calceolata.AAC.10